MKVTKNDILYWTGLLTAIWFAWTGMIWTYNAALVIAYPMGLISFLNWLKVKKDNKRRNIFIPIILAIGLVLSISVLAYFILFD